MLVLVEMPLEAALAQEIWQGYSALWHFSNGIRTLLSELSLPFIGLGIFHMDR